ncbi:MAG: PocR ligand-binding domain-containing protein [Terrimicrobiaceae bacterium]
MDRPTDISEPSPATIPARGSASAFDDVTFPDLFDLEEIQKIQDSFSLATGVASVITDPAGQALTRPSNFCRLCADLIRKTELGLAGCRRSDAVLENARPGGFFAHRCLSAGFWDGGAGIYAGERHIANWLIGQVLDESVDLEKVIGFGREIGADEAAFREALEQVPRMSRERFSNIGDALFLIAQQFSRQALQNLEVRRLVAGKKTAELELRDSEERFRVMLQHIPAVSVQGYYLDGTTHYWNDASEVLYGYPAKEAIGRNLLDLIIPPEMHEGVREAIAWMARTLQPIPASELTLLRKDGSHITVFSSHAIVMGHGHRPELFCIDIDLTDRKRAEETLRELNRNLEEATVRAEKLTGKAEAAVRAKSEFLAVVSHELRTPLNGVLGFAELLAETPLDDEQHRFVRTILDSGNHLLEVVNDILDFSSMEKGLMVIDKAPILIEDLVKSSCHPIRKAALDKGLEFHCLTSPDVPAQISGDARRIRQILINLLGNAVKFTSTGSVILRLTTVAEGGSRVVDFSVEDTGPGIPPTKLELLFKPFTQAESTLSRPFEGAGLGLAISKRLAEAMGGSISVLSTPGRGSRFTFRLPDVATEGPAALPAEPAGSPDLSPLGGLVLVVEDDSVSSLLLGKILSVAGCRAEFAGNGLEAVRTFAPGKFSAILMDMQMPVMDGIEATKKIRKIEADENCGRVPILALTANVMPGDRDRCLAVGMDDFLSKPFKSEQLCAKLVELTRGRRENAG